MLITKTCNSCGAALSDDCPLDVCPRCVVRQVLGQTAHPIGDAAESVSPHSTASVEQPGEFIGHYKLLQKIGEGGFGVVFLAEQERPVRRRVALKIIKPGMDTRQVIARFEAERQALAMMDHPNIAKVLDAGTTGEGDRGLGDRRQGKATVCRVPVTCHPIPDPSASAGRTS